MHAIKGHLLQPPPLYKMLSYFGKRKQVTKVKKVTFHVKEQNVSVISTLITLSYLTYLLAG